MRNYRLHLFKNGRLSPVISALPFVLLWFIYYGHVAYHYARTGFPPPQDDDYIVFVYAKNFLAGRGLVFNAGEHVWGYTSPLYALFLCALGFFTKDMVFTAACENFLFHAFTVAAAFCFAVKIVGPGWATIFGLLLLQIIDPFSYLYRETYLLLLLQMLFLLASRSSYYRTAALLASAACLTRPDSILLTAPIMALSGSTRKMRDFTLFFLPGILWLTFAFIYYGAIVPQSLIAKHGLSGFWDFLDHASRMSLGVAIPSLDWRNAGTSVGEMSRLPASVAFFFALMLMFDPKTREFRPMLYLVFYPASIIFLYAAIGSYMGHDWEFASATYFFAFNFLLGITVVLWRRAKVSNSGSSSPFFSTLALPFLFALGTLGVFASRALPSFETLKDDCWFGARNRTYERVSAWVRQHITDPQATLAVSEVGYIGYHTDVHIVDVSGIVTVGYKSKERMNHVAMAKRYRPNFLLLYGARHAMRLLPDLSYEPIQYFPKDGFEDFTLMQRVE